MWHAKNACATEPEDNEKCRKSRRVGTSADVWSLYISGWASLPILSRQRQGPVAAIMWTFLPTPGIYTFLVGQAILSPASLDLQSKTV